MITLPASCAWTAAGLRASLPHGSPAAACNDVDDPDRVGRVLGGGRRTRLAGDRGEGVISAAIAVLIVAFLGALMWVGFQTMWKNTETRTNQQVDNIGKG
jgi:hypothetical protein